MKSKEKLEKSNNEIIESTNIATSTKHILLMSKNELQNCRLCNHSFKTKSSLNRHIGAAHELKKPLGWQELLTALPMVIVKKAKKFSVSDSLFSFIAALESAL